MGAETRATSSELRRRATQALVAALTAVAALASPPARAAANCAGETEPAEVAAVADARTLELADGRLVRLAGIEPFTLLQPEAADAEERLVARLRGLVVGKPVSLALLSDKPDRYGRLPALVVAGGVLLQAGLARDGLAIAYAGSDALACFDAILAAEAEARKAGAGFWAGVMLPQARPEALLPLVGRFVIFEGKVLTVGTRPATSYLDFGRTWTRDVTIEIAARNRDAFGGAEALEKLPGSTIRARGFLAEKGGPMLEVRSPAELEILAPDTQTTRNAP